MLKAKRARAYAFLLLNTLVWGAFLPIVKLGFNDASISPFRFLLYRFALAGLLATPIVVYYWRRLQASRRQPFAVFGKVLLLELLQTSLGMTLLYLGLEQTSALETNFIATSLPLFVIFGGIFFLREKQERREWLGLVLALFGTLVIVLEPLWHDQNGFTGSVQGNLLVIGYNVVTAAYLLLAKKHYKGLPKLFISGLSFYLGAVTFALLSWLEAGSQWLNFTAAVSLDLSSPLVWGVIVYAAVFGSIIGLTAYIKGQDGIEASEASLFTYLQPAIYIPLGYLLLRESASLWQIFALVIIVAGVYIAGKRKGV